MAKSTEQYYDEIMTEAGQLSSLQGLEPQPDDSQQFLDDLTTTSQVAEHRIWAWITAFFMHLLDKLFDTHKAEVEAIAARAKPQTAPWYRQKLLEFQYGDPLVYPDNVPVYATIDPAKQIIKRAAVVSSGGAMIVKVATLSGSNLQPLTSLQLNAVKAYIHEIEAPGTNAQVFSLPADTLRLTADIYFDAQFVQGDVQAAVEAAINNYLANLPFDGTVYLNGSDGQPGLIDAIQAVNGVDDVELASAEAKNGAVPYAAFTRVWSTVAGYIIEDTSTGNAFADTITYVPNV